MQLAESLCLPPSQVQFKLRRAPANPGGGHRILVEGESAANTAPAHAEYTIDGSILRAAQTPEPFVVQGLEISVR